LRALRCAGSADADRDLALRRFVGPAGEGLERAVSLDRDPPRGDVVDPVDHQVAPLELHFVEPPSAQEQRKLVPSATSSGRVLVAKLIADTPPPAPTELACPPAPRRLAPGDHRVAPTLHATPLTRTRTRTPTCCAAVYRRRSIQPVNIADTRLARPLSF